MNFQHTLDGAAVSPLSVAECSMFGRTLSNGIAATIMQRRIRH
jgi:hypothetical protein